MRTGRRDCTEAISSVGLQHKFSRLAKFYWKLSEVHLYFWTVIQSQHWVCVDNKLYNFFKNNSSTFVVLENECVLLYFLIKILGQAKFSGLHAEYGGSGSVQKDFTIF